MTAAATSPGEFRRLTLAAHAICLKGICWREGLRFLHQRERFVSALVRPLVWLFIFAAGFRQVLGISIIPPYDATIWRPTTEFPYIERGAHATLQHSVICYEKSK